MMIFQRKSAPRQPPPKPQEPVAQAPLVIAQPTRPIVVKDTDSEQPEVSAEQDPQPKKGAAGRYAGRSGTIDAGQVNRFINARFAQVKSCYERRLKNNPLLEGKLDLNINISTKGKVRAITVNRDTVGDSEMLKCVRQTINRWSFPKPTGGSVVIGKTFNFKKKT